MYKCFTIVRLNTCSYKGINTRSLENRVFPVKLRPFIFPLVSSIPVVNRIGQPLFVREHELMTICGSTLDIRNNEIKNGQT